MNEFDKKLKDLANEQKEKAPNNIRERAKLTCENLENRKSKISKRLLPKVAAVFIIIFLSADILFPTFAERLPIIGPVFESVNEKFGLNEVYSEYGVEVNKEAQFGDLKLKIEDVVYDGVELLIFYKVSSDKPLKDISYPLFDLGLEARWYGQVLTGGMSTGYKIDEYNYYGMSRLDLQVRFLGKLLNKKPEKLSLSFNIKELDGWDGENQNLNNGSPLKFTLSLDSSKIPKKDIEINKKVKTEYGDIIFDKLTITPVSIDIYYSTNSPNNSLDFNLLLREKNLGPLELGGGSASSQGRNKMAGYMRITLDSLEEMKNLSELEIIPVVNNMQNSENNKEENLDKYYDITINTDRPTIIKSDDNGELEVRSIEFKDNEALISIKATGDKVYERPAFYDNEDKWYSNNRIINRNFVDGTFTYTMVMDKMDKYNEYFYRDYHEWESGTILEDEKITVKVK